MSGITLVIVIVVPALVTGMMAIVSTVFMVITLMVAFMTLMAITTSVTTLGGAPLLPATRPAAE